MKHLGIEVPVKNVPELDPGFLPWESSAPPF